MAEVINDGNRRARLAAMAQGGTAGVEAFDAAQQAASQQQQQAVQAALSTGWHPGNRLVAGELAGEARRWTAPYVRDAQLGGDLAGEQVGYDRAAYDSFLRRGEEALDLRRNAMAHERTMSSYSQRLRDAEHNAKLKSVQSSAEGFAGSGMDKTELEAYLRGAGMIAQQKEAAKSGRQAGLAGQRSDLMGKAASLVARGAQKTQAHQMTAALMDVLGQDQQARKIRRRGDLGATAGEAQKGMRAASIWDSIGWGDTANRVRSGVADESKRASDVARQQAAVQSLLTGVVPDAIGVERARAEGKQREQMRTLADEDRFAREAAIAAGIDPAMALGLFPSDPGDVAARMDDLTAQRNMEIYGHPDGELGAMKDELSDYDTQIEYQGLEVAKQTGLPLDYATSAVEASMQTGASVSDVLSAVDEFGLDGPQDVPEQNQRLAELAELLQGAADPKSYLEDLAADPDVELSDAEFAFLARQFGVEVDG